MPNSAQIKLKRSNLAPPIVTASTVPNITGMVDAGKANGRIATHQIFGSPGLSCVSVDVVMVTLFLSRNSKSLVIECRQENFS